MTTRPDPMYAGYRFPAEVISYAVYLYFRFPLSLRMVEEMLGLRGVTVSHETVRQWGLKFGREIATRIRQRRLARGDKWHLDEVVISIAGSEALPVAGGRPRRLCSRRARAKSARHAGGQASAAQAVEEAGPGAAGADHR
jgi:putative transposase